MPDKKIGNCSYRLCEFNRKKKTNVFFCDFCKKYYCEEHQNPKQPSMFPAGDIVNKRDVGNWRARGHPDVSFADFKIKKEKEKKEKWQETLKQLTSHKLPQTTSTIENSSKNRNYEKTYTYERDTKLKHSNISKSQMDSIKKIGIIIAVMIVGYAVFTIFTGKYGYTVSLLCNPDYVPTIALKGCLYSPGGLLVTCTDENTYGMSYGEKCKQICYNNYRVTSYKIDPTEKQDAISKYSHMCLCDVNNCGGAIISQSEIKTLQTVDVSKMSEVPCSSVSGCQQYFIQKGEPIDQVMKYYKFTCQSGKCYLSIEIR